MTQQAVGVQGWCKFHLKQNTLERNKKVLAFLEILQRPFKKSNHKILNDKISYFAESHADFYCDKIEDPKKWMMLRRSFRSGMLQSLKILNGDDHTVIL